MFDKIVTSLVQMAVVLAIYVPILVGYRLWARWRMNRVIAPFTPGKCICGKWSMPTAIGAETDVTISIGAPSAVVFSCPECGVPHVTPVKTMLLRSKATTPPAVRIVR